MSDKGRRGRVRYLEMWQDMPMKNKRPAGEAPLAAFDLRSIIPRLTAYRDQTWGHSPSAAEEAQVALSAFLTWAKTDGRLDFNRLSGVPSPYVRVEKQRLWSAQEQALFIQSAPEHLKLAFRLLILTGLRLGDLVRLPVTAVRREHVIIPTGKSGGRREAIIPLIEPLRAVLDECREFRGRFDLAQTTVLVNSRGMPWTADGFSTSFNRQRAAVGLGSADNGPTIHDGRKTAATNAVILQQRYPVISDAVLTDWFAWTPADLEKMKRIYVSDAAVIAAITGDR